MQRTAGPRVYLAGSRELALVAASLVVAIESMPQNQPQPEPQSVVVKILEQCETPLELPAASEGPEDPETPRNIPE